MTDLTRITLPSGIELDVWDSGPKNAPALIFLHGFPENHRTWRHQIEYLNDRFRCIAPDQRGYGHSARPEGVENYEPMALAQDIFGLAQALELGEYTILGHDWGGAIAWVIAAFGQGEGHVVRAVIANAPHPVVFPKLLLEDERQRAASQYIRAFRDPANDILVQEHGLGGLLMKEIKWEGRTSNDPAETARMLEQWSEPSRAFAMLNWYRASGLHVPSMDDPYGVPASFRTPDFPVLKIPTLVVWGMDDQALLPANIDGLDDWITDLTREKIDGAGHFVPWEAPQAVNSALDRFLAD